MELILSKGTAAILDDGLIRVGDFIVYEIQTSPCGIAVALSIRDLLFYSL